MNQNPNYYSYTPDLWAKWLVQVLITIDLLHNPSKFVIKIS